MSVKIAHISDCHIGVGYPGPTPFSRFQDVEKILNWTANKLIEEKVDLCLVCGDCFKDAKIMVDRAEKELGVVVRFLRKLSNAGIESIVISGTPSHDCVSIYHLLDEMGIAGVHIFTTPGISPWPGDKVKVACLPGLNRSALMTQDEYKGLPPEQVHRIMTDKITQLCIGMASQMPNYKPKILMAHMTYQGADTGFQDLLMQHEPILTREAVSGFDLVCLGHIHRPQQIDGKVFYSGPIERLSFNDESITPGFWIHEIGPNQEALDKVRAMKNEGLYIPAHDPYITYDFIETPARRYQTLNFDEGSIQGFSQHGSRYFGSYVDEDVKDAIVRLRYSCSEEVAKQLNRKELEKALYQAGAFFIQEIKSDILRTDRSRDAQVIESLSVGQALDRWCVQQGIDETERAVLGMMTNELLEGVQA